jgi:hypothetical protein
LYHRKVDTSNKIAKYIKTMGVINNALKPSLVQRHSWLCLYILLAWQILSYRSEAWTIRKQDINRITACQMKSMWRTACYTKQDHRRNEGILNKLEIIQW